MTDPGETWTVAIDADTSALQNELKQASQLGRGFATSLITAFEGIAIKGRSVGDVLKGLTLSLSQMVLKAAFKPLEQGFGQMLAGALSGSGGGFGFANGGAFQQSMPVPFAKGGVIASPVSFPLGRGLTGLAGERGAEAIMPLARGPDGRLGVVSQGTGGPQITINVQTQDVESFRRSQTQVAAMLARAVSLGQRNL